MTSNNLKIQKKAVPLRHVTRCVCMELIIDCGMRNALLLFLSTSTEQGSTKSFNFLSYQGIGIHGTQGNRGCD